MLSVNKRSFKQNVEAFATWKSLFKLIPNEKKQPPKAAEPQVSDEATYVISSKIPASSFVSEHYCGSAVSVPHLPVRCLFAMLRAEGPTK